jgi:hypothetical protein
MCFPSLTIKRHGQEADVKGGCSPFILTLDAGFPAVLLTGYVALFWKRL